MVINVKMPTTVGILTFITMINTASARSVIIFQQFNFYEQLKFHELSIKEKALFTSGAGHRYWSGKWYVLLKSNILSVFELV